MAPTETPSHWDNVWSTKEPDAVSWHQDQPRPSLDLVQAADARPDARIVDIGGGASTLVDHLLAAGYQDVTVVDIAAKALERARQRLGDDATRVHWRTADVTQEDVGGQYDVWHDRAVFHFLVHPDERRAYGRALLGALAPGGAVVIGTFASDGPTQCSGLPVCRYDTDGLVGELGAGFETIQASRHVHTTPWGDSQPFQYVWLRRTA